MAGLTIDSFSPATLPLATGQQFPVGQGSAPTQTYKADIIELQKYIQRQLNSAVNNGLGPDVTIINGYVSVSSAGNNLTVSLLSLDGDDPSATDPVFIVFRNASLTIGSYVVRAITSALNFTINSPNTLGIASGAAELFVVAIDNAGTVSLGAVNAFVSATAVYVPDQWSLKSTVAGNGGNSSNVIYAPLAVTNRPIRPLAMLRWANLVTPGTWTMPTSIHNMGSSSMLGRLQEAINDYLSRINTLTTAVNARAPLASPAFTGTPTAPTPGAGTNNTQIATTAFVASSGVYGTGNPAMDGAATPGVAASASRSDHVHPTDTSRAPVASPTFTGTATAGKFSTGSFINTNGYDVGHLLLYGTQYGVGISSGQINWISGGTQRWWSGTVNTLLLDASGNLTATANVTAYSDPKLKDNIRPLDDARDILRCLSGYRFEWNEDAHRIGINKTHDIGLLSNQVKEVLPEFVVTVKSDGENGIEYETVDYARVVAVLVPAFNEQELLIETQQREINQLQDQLDGILSRLATLEAK